MQPKFNDLRQLMNDPTGFLDRQRIDLHVYPDALQLPGRQVYGCWDPLTRTIALYHVGDRSDEQLVATLIHEAYHAVSGSRDEDTVKSFVTTIMDSIATTEIHHCADTLRCLVRHHTAPRVTAENCKRRHPFFPGGVSV